MKVRTGFVSNSSSSSFCILGVNSDQKGWGDKYPDDIYNTHEKLRENNLTYARGVGDYDYDYDYSDVFVGMSPYSLNDNVTIWENKREIAKRINAIYGTTFTENDISWYIDGGYDG